MWLLAIQWPLPTVAKNNYRVLCKVRYVLAISMSRYFFFFFFITLTTDVSDVYKPEKIFFVDNAVLVLRISWKKIRPTFSIDRNVKFIVWSVSPYTCRFVLLCPPLIRVANRVNADLNYYIKSVQMVELWPIETPQHTRHETELKYACSTKSLFLTEKYISSNVNT